MQGSSWNKGSNHLEHEIFSQLRIPPDTPFFVRLDGRRFQVVSEKVGAEKPFDKIFAQCLVASAKAVFQSGFNSALVYVASDELDVLFLRIAPFRQRVEKINSILAGIASSLFSLNILKFFKKSLTVSFNSRIAVYSKEEILEYLLWRQRDAWRNHNNAYGYWLLRRRGHKLREASKMLKGLKTKGLHEVLFCQGVNLAQTPAWQRRGILVYRARAQMKNHTVTRWRIKDNWDHPLFSSTEGPALIQQILEWSKST